MNSNYLASYLFTWNANPKYGNWGNDFERNIEQLSKTRSFTDTWHCSNKNIKFGDRAFLIKLGEGKRGIFASGYISSEEPFRAKHWSDESKPDVDYVSIDFDVLINPEKDEILSIDFLQSLPGQQHWSSQSSGIVIRKEVVPVLEKAWLPYLNNRETSQHLISSSGNSFIEGKSTEFLSVRFERNPHARNACLEKYGYKCSVCEFDFHKFYGEIGTNFIHVHHLNEVSKIREIYRIDPINDLRPVCPNCHAMLHKRKEPFTIDELKLQISKTDFCKREVNGVHPD